ncbi:adenine deaminase C-terminal domain-containing protein [Natrialbaceae archaeon A-gly3]
MNDLQPISLGDGHADIVVEGGRVFCSNRGEFLERDVAIVGDRIAAILEDDSDAVGPGTTVVSAAGRPVIPGLIDAHTHVDLYATTEQLCPHLLATGTTSVVTEVSGFGTTLGARGTEAYLEATADLPLSVYPTLAPQPLVDTFEPRRADGAELEALADLFDHERVVGVGEIDWIHVVGRDSPVEALYERAREAGVRIVGHGAGCRGESLQAFATIVDNDHEPITREEAVDRAEQGLHVVARCGSTRDDLAAVADPLAAGDLAPGSVSLSTDGVWPTALCDGFGMAELLRRTIEAGVDPAVAIDTASRNTAEHFGLEGRGVIAPGAYADLVIVDDLESMAVETVLADGKVVVENGSPVIDPPTVSYPEFVFDTIDVSTDRERFTVPQSVAPGSEVRAMEVGQGLLTLETTVEPALEEDRFVPAPERDVLTATVIDRDPETPDRGFTGFLTGYGLEAGAVATTNSWEIPGLVTIAADPDDAALAARRVADNGGGWAIVRDGEVLTELPMPVAAFATQEPVPSVAAGFEDLEVTLHELGVSVERPLLTAQTLTFPGVPALKLAVTGYADVLGREVVGLESG